MSPRLLPLLAALACAVGTSPSALARPATRITAVDPGRPLIAQSTCDEARDRVFDWAATWAVQSQIHAWYPSRPGGMPRTAGGAERSAPTSAPAADASATATGGSAGPGHYTGTNNQERGVDEADLVKTDGKFVYTVHGSEVIIARSWPASAAEIVARHPLGPQVTPQQLLLLGDRLVVLSQVYQQTSQVAARGGRHVAMQPYFHGTRLTVLDVTRRERPRRVHQADVEGWMTQARSIGRSVYLVSNAGLAVPPAVQQVANQAAARFARKRLSPQAVQAQQRRAFAAVRAQLERRFPHLSLTASMPRQRHASGAGAFGATRPLYACGELHVPPGGGQLGTLNIVQLDVDRPAALRAVGLLASGWQIYASTGAIYAAMPNYGWYSVWGWDAPSAADRERFNTTVVHKFDLRGERPRYAATGAVRGHVLNQFSMSEHRGHLRLATTDQTWWGGGGQAPGGNHLYVLAERGRRLAKVGGIEDLAPGERIYSARMMGDKGYMVTFRQTDPLFTFDLSDPRRPRVVGELKINGFSSYIHPLGPDHLLTIGQDATDEGRVLGAHLQIFDVSDPARPRRTAHRRLTDEGGFAWSAAQWDHHAFTYDPVTGVLGVPMSTYHPSDPEKSFMGLVVLKVRADRFVELGRISHVDLAAAVRQVECAASVGVPSYPCSSPVHQDWRAQIQRSIVIDDTILTLSGLGFQLSRLGRPDRTLARVPFARAPVALAR